MSRCPTSRLLARETQLSNLADTPSRIEHQVNDSASADTDPFQGIAIVLCDGARSSKNKEDKRDIRPDEQKMFSAVVAFLRGRNYRRNW